MKHRCHALLLGFLIASLPAPAADAPAPLDAYTAIGASMVRDNRLGSLGWSDAQVAAFIRGVEAEFHGRGVPLDPAAQDLLNQIGRRMQEQEAAEQRERYGTEAFARPGYLAAYLKEMRKKFKLEASDSGLSYQFVSAGFGARPGPDDTVVISYKVTKADARTDVPELQVNGIKARVSDLLPGLAEVLQMMTVDALAMAILPPDLSYGSGKWPPGTDPGTPLLYTVKLHEIVPAR
jgi:FKBP-type peptidyl-prolyl cis-trans isomerase